MGRNDGYHHHKPSSHSRGSSSGSKHHHHRQHQQHVGSSGSHQNFRLGQSYQISPFIAEQQIAPVLMNPQFSQTIFSPQQQQPQIYYNQSVQYTPYETQSDIIPKPPIWFNPCPQNLADSSGLTPSVNLPLEQSIPAAALNKLQLPANQITETGIIPNTPYYDLPAALIVPLISPTRADYKTVNPSDLRLPLPKFPDENFLRTIDAYYGSDGKSRDNDGWDREFIDAYLAQKKTQTESSFQLKD